MSIELRDVTVGWESTMVLRRLSLDVPSRSVTVLTGPSGCGKSTVLRCVLGFVRPVEGSVRIAGEELDRQSVWRLRARIAYVPQEPELGDWRVWDWIVRPLHFRANRDLDSGERAIYAWAERLRLSRELLAKRARDLSGGEKQRVSLLGALLLDREILLLDEPTSALDRDVRRDVSRIIERLSDRTRLAVLHDREHFPFADQTIALRERDLV